LSQNINAPTKASDFLDHKRPCCHLLLDGRQSGDYSIFEVTSGWAVIQPERHIALRILATCRLHVTNLPLLSSSPPTARYEWSSRSLSDLAGS
jgi:hypothetical protein